MQITRNNHQRYMARLTPFLVLLYVAQVFLYQRFAPPHLSSDMNVFLGVGLALIILLYHFYDIHHKVTLKPNYIEARFDLLKIKEEMLYQNVVHVEIKKSRFHYAQVTLHGVDGEMIRLHHVDSPELIEQYIQKKKSKRP
ncbi:hypothetical protein ACJVC5_15200 [Peredibacter sp. HCB2-198]|uniref:hypothetical protein n=1 Tax=Peredibacter sp. HCB2-198 TaxID=3383025 RepID=UPI0038B4A6D2